MQSKSKIFDHSFLRLDNGILDYFQSINTSDVKCSIANIR